MDNVTLNGFEVFEDLMPGASVKNKQKLILNEQENNSVKKNQIIFVRILKLKLRKRKNLRKKIKK